MLHECSLQLPRYAFSPRNAARAGDIWRACQEIATSASTAAGWPPSRYKDERVGFIVREMTCVHHRETAHGERLTARTWVQEFRRGMVTTRQIRVAGELGPLADATQEWVHVAQDGDRLRVARGSDALVAAFAPSPAGEDVALPGWEPLESSFRSTSFACFHVWMDPLGHVNHPVYVDWCDEGVMRGMARAGLDPAGLRPIAERVAYRTGVVAGDEVAVDTRLCGRTPAGDAVFEHVLRKNGEPCATATTIRALAGGGTEALVAAWR